MYFKPRPPREKHAPVKTAVGLDRVRPTSNQISHGVIVVPKVFIEASRGIIWHSFRAFFLGDDVGIKRLDQDNRLRLPLRGVLKAGDVLHLSVRDGALHIERVVQEV